MSGQRRYISAELLQSENTLHILHQFTPELTEQYEMKGSIVGAIPTNWIPAPLQSIPMRFSKRGGHEVEICAGDVRDDSFDLTIRLLQNVYMETRGSLNEKVIAAN